MPLMRDRNSTPPRRQRSVSRLLTVMALSIAAPIIVACIMSLGSEYFERRNAIENRIADTSAALSLAVDREIASIQAALQVLAQSPALARGDLRQFYDEAVGLQSLYPDSNVVLADSTGQEVIGTFAPFGAKLPVRAADLPWSTIFKDGQPTVSNLFKGAVTKVPAISIDVPVFIDGKVRYDLALSMHANRFTALMRELALPPGWVGTLIDRNMTIVARSVDPDAYVGERAVRQAPEPGTVIRNLLALDGRHYISGITHSARTGWSTGVLAPTASAFSGLWAWVGAEAAFLVLVVVAGGFAARRVARRIAGSVTSLVAPARAVGEGTPVTVPPLEIIEADAVARSLNQAAELLARREKQRADAEAERQSAHERLETTFRAAPVSIIVIGEDGTIKQCNRSAAAHMRRAGASGDGTSLLAFATTPEAREMLAGMLFRLQAGQSFHGIVVRDRSATGAPVTFSLCGSPMGGRDGAFHGGVLVAQDITDLMNAEEQLRQSARLQAVWQLTGGIAHDFNNLLAIQMLSLGAALRALGDDPDTAEVVNNALTAAEKGAELTRRLLAFARRQVLTPFAVDVGELVRGVSALIRRTIGERITLDIRIDPEVWPVFVDPVQLDSALINLASNARDAMPDGGTLTITAGNLRLDDARAAGYGDLLAGDYVAIDVSDTGEGMSEDVARRAIEPFFTTKEPGKGSGLGLSMVFGFVSQSRGTLSVDSKVGAGTRIRLLLPRSTAPVTARAGGSAPVPTLGHGERILVVEDSDALRSTLERHLQSLKYTFRTAENGDKAAQMLERERFALVLTDVVMPGKLDGIALARMIARRWPQTRVILTSGYADNITAAGAETFPSDTRLLVKPYRLDELAAMLRAMLQPNAPQEPMVAAMADER